MPADTPLISLFQMLPDSPLPVPAAKGRAVNVLPAKAVRYCPPITEATGLGWHLFPAFDVALRFDGRQVHWIRRDVPDAQWQAVAPGAEAVVPEWVDHFEANVPPAVLERVDDDRPGLFNADPAQPHRIEMDLGVIAETAPGWAVLLREPANAPRRPDIRVMEGIIETDWYGAYLTTIVEFLEVDRVVELRTWDALVQLQLVPKMLLDPATSGQLPEPGRFDDLPDRLWDRYSATRDRRVHTETMGSYKQHVQQLRRESRGGCPFGHA